MEYITTLKQQMTKERNAHLLVFGACFLPDRNVLLTAVVGHQSLAVGVTDAATLLTLERWKRRKRPPA